MQCEETTGGAYMEKKKKTELASLPEELIIQILLRLPVTSLIRIKSVCKSWLSLISDSHFANSHFQLYAATPTRRILYMSTLPTHQSRSVDFQKSSLVERCAYASLNFNLLPFQSYSHIKIKASCRGFLLLHCYIEHSQLIYDIYLWNPSTGFYKKIPSSPFVYHSDHYTNFYGFGYDQSTDDYLLVTMSYKKVNYDGPLPHSGIFSLRANKWQEIVGTQFTYRNIRDYQPPIGFLFNGAIHWFAYCHDLQKKVIVAFDLMEKKLFNLHLPADFDRKLYGFGLWTFGEFLGLWAVYNRKLKIWVMKEYKVDSPWTKTLVLPFEGYYPICSTKSGDIVANSGSGLAIYNDQGQRQETRSYLDVPNECEVALYIESLLLLPDNEHA